MLKIYSLNCLFIKLQFQFCIEIFVIRVFQQQKSFFCLDTNSGNQQMVVNVTTWELGDLEFTRKHYRPMGLLWNPRTERSLGVIVSCCSKNVLTVDSLYIFEFLMYVKSNKIIIPTNSLVGLRNLNNRIKEDPISQCSFLSIYSN